MSDSQTADRGKLIPIRDVPKAVAAMTGGATTPSVSQIYRWISSGNRGVRLRRVYIGRVSHTYESWLRDCIDATEPPEPVAVSDQSEPVVIPMSPEKSRTQNERKQKRRRAGREELRKLGITG